MAVDELLLDRAARTGESVFRVYSWRSPTLSFGRNQRACGAYDRASIAARGFDVVRRPTGGRALMHHREVTYSVTAPLGDRSLRATYDDINVLVLDGLRRLGVNAVIQSRDTHSIAPGPTPCFVSPSAGEITIGGRKLVGSAQWHGEHALLQHGSILVHDDQGVIPDLSIGPLPVIPPPATLAESLGREPSVSEVTGALFDALRASHPTARAFSEAEEDGVGADPLCWLSDRQHGWLGDSRYGCLADRQHRWLAVGPPSQLSDRQPTEALADVANRYRDESWTWRR